MASLSVLQEVGTAVSAPSAGAELGTDAAGAWGTATQVPSRRTVPSPHLTPSLPEEQATTRAEHPSDHNIEVIVLVIIRRISFVLVSEGLSDEFSSTDVPTSSLTYYEQT